MDSIVVDLEATCWEGCRTEEMEIIEIGAVRLEGEVLRSTSEFDQFVRPTHHPQLSAFCRELTGIDQHTVASAPRFPDAFNRFVDWIGPAPFRLCSWGDFDRELFEHELERHEMDWPPDFLYHVNLKARYAETYLSDQSIGLREALHRRGLTFEGDPHRGIDDARNVSRIAQTILEGNGG